MEEPKQTDHALTAVIIALTVVVFVLDLMIPLGVTVWALYILPQGLTRWAPFVAYLWDRLAESSRSDRKTTTQTEITEGHDALIRRLQRSQGS